MPHTPGPWNNTEHSTGGKHDGHLIVSSDGYNIANIWHTKYIVTPDRIAEQDANAWLITVAPELLAELKRLQWSASLPNGDGAFEPCCPACSVPMSRKEHAPLCSLACLVARAKSA